METIGKIIYQIDAGELEEILQKVIIKEMDKLKLKLIGTQDTMIKKYEY